jgi:hypothetical protein
MTFPYWPMKFGTADKALAKTAAIFNRIPAYRGQ